MTVFGAERPVVGMVHLPPLPGAPGYDADGGRAAIHETARRDAARLDAVLVENFGDVLAVAGSVIVGSALKEDGEASNPVSAERVEGLVADAVR